MEKNKYWSPYVAGSLSGFVSIFSVWIAGKYLGASTTFVKTAAMVEQVVAPEKLKLAYFLQNKPTIDWQWMFVLGVGLGALIAAVSSSTFKWQAVPDMWSEHFGKGIGYRGVVGFIGGIVAMFGARLADGCPSGHGLSGGLQLSVSGYVALVFFFVGGLISANLLYRGGSNK